MPESQGPNVGVSLLVIHRCITRAIDMAHAHSLTFARAGFPDARTCGGFGDYVRSLATLLHAHHLMEDELAFPRFRDAIPAPYGQLEADHKQITARIDQIRAAIDQASGPAPAEPLRQLAKALSEVTAIWNPHIAIEEAHFTTAKTDEVLGPEGQLEMAMQIGQYNQKYAAPDYLVVPFTLMNLSPEDRQILAAGMPPVIMQELVPVVWKEKWQPMAPFLLP